MMWKKQYKGLQLSDDSMTPGLTKTMMIIVDIIDWVSTSRWFCPCLLLPLNQWNPLATFLASNGWIRAPPLEKTGRPSVRRAGCAGDVQDGLWSGVCQDARWLGARELAANPSNFAFKTTAPARHKSQMWWSHVVKSQKLVGHTQAMYQHIPKQT